MVHTQETKQQKVLIDLMILVDLSEEDLKKYDDKISDFLMKDSEYSQKYFTQWLGQIL